MNTKVRPIIFLLAIFVAATIFFRQSFGNFFFQDDFFNIRLSLSQGLFDAFNIFKKPILDFNFYRPLTTQLFWSTLYQAFFFNPLPYHLVVHFFYLANIALVYYLTTLINPKKTIALLTAFLYAFSSTHFYRLFFLSQFQEVALATFVLLTVIFYLRDSRWSIVFLLLSLACKETAVVVPLVLVFHDYLFSGKVKRKISPLAVIVLVYFVVRKMFFGFASGGAYDFNWHPKSVLNNLSWYSLWALGLPESFVNLKIFFVSKFDEVGKFISFSVINPDFFTSFGSFGGPILLSFGFFLLTLLLGLTKNLIRQVFRKDLIWALAFFLIFLFPVAFFPFHKFAYSLTLPIFGLSFILAKFVAGQNLRFQVFGIFFYLLLSFLTLQYNLKEHWATGKAYTAKTAFAYFQEKYPDVGIFRNIYFQNDDRIFCSPDKPPKDLSTEAAYGLGGVEGLRLLYNNPKLGVFYYDWDHYENFYADSLVLDSRLFLRR